MTPAAQEAHRAAIERAIATADASLDRLAERAGARRAADHEARYQERLREQEAPTRPSPTAERRLVEQLVDQRVAAAIAGHRRQQDAAQSKLMGLLGAEVGRMQREERERWLFDLAAAKAKADERVAELEARLAKMETRAEEAAAEQKRLELSPPKLVGFVGRQHAA